MQKLKVTALLGGEPAAHDLWTLRRIASVGCELRAVQARRERVEPPLERAKTAIRRFGPLGAFSRLIGSTIASRIDAKDRELLEQLFDIDDLRAWWTGSGIVPARVPALNHADAVAALEASTPDVIVRVSGGLLERRIYTKARLAALNVHHGQAPSIRGMWSIPWGIIEGRRDWIGATVHIIDEGIDTGPILWRAGPQLAPGDTNVDLFFRAHLEAGEALARILRIYADGGAPPPWIPAESAPSTYRSAAGVRDWIRLLALDQGRRARVLIERGIKC
ncbi:MAG: formyltransferase family protein [Elusimicrobiota bacterium]